MTLDEHHTFLILERLLPTKNKHLSKTQYYDLTEDITGNSKEYLKTYLLQKGFLEEGNYIDEKTPTTTSGHFNQVYRIFLTDIGVKAYYDLKKKKRNESYQKIGYGLTLFFAFVSALYGVLTYYGVPKNQSSSEQSSQTSLNIPTTDKIKQTKSSNADTLQKNASSVDTTKQNTKAK